MARPELSIIIPTYNMAKWLPYAVESCLWQTEPDIEVIILDDGSSDGTRDIAQEYVRADSRVRYHFKENGGLSSARRTGQGLSKGKYLFWLDADDFLDRNMARDMLGVARRDQVEMVCGNSVVFSNRTFNTRRYFYHPAVSQTTFDNKRYWKCKVVWRWIISTDFINRINVYHPDLRLSQDVVVMYQLLSQVGRFSQCPSFVHYFRQEHKTTYSSLETEINHQLAHYRNVKDVLVGAGRIKPLIKHLSENYVRDIRKTMPRLTGEDAAWIDRVEELSLEIFSGMSLDWFEPAFAAPELPPPPPELRAIARAALTGTREDLRVELVRWIQPPKRTVDKKSTFHTLRRRLKAFIAPLSIRARRRQAALHALAHRRLSEAWPR